jgi:hypothetical protein
MSGMHHTRQAARAAGEKFYVSGTVCRKCGKAGRRYVSSANCVECAVALQVSRYETRVGGVLPKRAFKQARKAAPNAKYVFTGVPCERGHMAMRRNVVGGSCMQCEQERNAERTAAHKGPKKTAKQRRAEALARGEKFYDPGRPCIYGHYALRYVKNKACVECMPRHNASNHAKHKQQHYAQQAVWRAKHREQAKKKSREWYRQNTDRATMHSRTRQARKKNAAPKWANLEAIKAIYKAAADLTKRTGIQHHVDHVVPLQSKLVCGLHCESNLQVLSADENMKKHNSYWPGMP